METNAVIQRFLDYVRIASPSQHEKNFKERLKQELLALGLEVYEDTAGEKLGSDSGNLHARLEGTGKYTILLSAHMDTVSPCNNVQPVIKDGIIYSDGTTVLGSDNKAAVAAIMEMLKIVVEQQRAHHTIEVLFTIFEEGGLFGSKYGDYSKLHADFGIVMDTGGAVGSVTLQGPAKNRLNVVFHGKAAHAAKPEAGVSAIGIATSAISKMQLSRIDEETTANIGSIRGGTATNILADKVEMQAEIRSLNNEKLQRQTENMIRCIENAEAKHGLKADIEVQELYRAFCLHEDAVPVQAVKSACEKLGLPFQIRKSAGGSDANNFNAHGIPTVNIGIGMANCHGLDEHIAIKDIRDCTRLLLEIVSP